MQFDVLEEAICADLNQDGWLDWVITYWLRGNIERARIRGCGPEQFQEYGFLHEEVSVRGDSGAVLLPEQNQSHERGAQDSFVVDREV